MMATDDEKKTERPGPAAPEMPRVLKASRLRARFLTAEEIEKQRSWQVGAVYRVPWKPRTGEADHE